jgi:ribosomal protein S18 acetylase RimI-like enzyme
MTDIVYRRAVEGDVAKLAPLRGDGLGDEKYWRKRIAGYLLGELHPQKALKERAILLAETEKAAVGFVAGHLTRRYVCDGELQWIDVLPEHQRRGIASRLIWWLAEWFAEHHAARVCVNVRPNNATARQFYQRRGAVEMNAYWLVWPDIGVVRKSSERLTFAGRLAPGKPFA